jgi:hypothetical protein
LDASDHEVVEALPDAQWLDPFGVEIRYPSDRPEALPGDEQRALQLSENTRVAVTKAWRSSLCLLPIQTREPVESTGVQIRHRPNAMPFFVPATTSSPFPPPD